MKPTGQSKEAKRARVDDLFKGPVTEVRSFLLLLSQSDSAFLLPQSLKALIHGAGAIEQEVASKKSTRPPLATLHSVRRTTPKMLAAAVTLVRPPFPLRTRR